MKWCLFSLENTFYVLFVHLINTFSFTNFLVCSFIFYLLCYYFHVYFFSLLAFNASICFLYFCDKFCCISNIMDYMSIVRRRWTVDSEHQHVCFWCTVYTLSCFTNIPMRNIIEEYNVSYNSTSIKKPVNRKNNPSKTEFYHLRKG